MDVPRAVEDGKRHGLAAPKSEFLEQTRSSLCSGIVTVWLQRTSCSQLYAYVLPQRADSWSGSWHTLLLSGPCCFQLLSVGTSPELLRIMLVIYCVGKRFHFDSLAHISSRVVLLMSYLKRFSL